MAKQDENPGRETAAPLEAGEPVEDVAVSQLGKTFAERQKARAKVEKRVSKDSAEDKSVSRSKSSNKSKR